MNIIKQKWEFLNSTLSSVPKQAKKLYVFGFMVLSLRKIDSLRANSRIPNLNWHTAKSKAYRLTVNKKFNNVFCRLINDLTIVGKKDIIAVDFSDFNGFQVLLFAKQTKKGRTAPVYFEIITYPIKKDSQNIFIIQAIEKFVKLVGFRPKLVMDRGFACPSIIAHLSQKRRLFVIRLKKIKIVEDRLSGLKFKVMDSLKNDCLVFSYEQKLRLVVSDKILEDDNEPWYLITNDLNSTREKIIENYYYRFEIEEFFRDAKRLLGLEYAHFKKQKSLSIVLWFVILGIWFIWTLEETIYDRTQRDKMRLSKIRYCLEKISSEIIMAAEGQFIPNFINTG